MLIPFPHRQEIFFTNGSRKIIDKVVKVEQGQWFHLIDERGREIITNPENILYVIVSPAKKND